jgi:hypothetical protein
MPVTTTVAKLCVCGHSEEDHIETTLSVVVPKSKRYYDDAWYNAIAAGIGSQKMNSRYEFDLCHCGCSDYQHDPEV